MASRTWQCTSCRLQAEYGSKTTDRRVRIYLTTTARGYIGDRPILLKTPLEAIRGVSQRHSITRLPIACHAPQNLPRTLQPVLTAMRKKLQHVVGRHRPGVRQARPNRERYEDRPALGRNRNTDAHKVQEQRTEAEPVHQCAQNLCDGIHMNQQS